MEQKSFENIKIGILGGGQLGRMILQEAINYNIDLHILDPNENAPCSGLSPHFVQGDFNNYDDVMAFGKNLDVITIEIEHVNIQALKDLESMGKQVFPQAQVVEIIQDKGLQKEFYKKHNLPTADFTILDSDVKSGLKNSSFPLVQKMRKGGYDGKGVQIIKSVDMLETAFDAPSVIEDMVPFEKELAVIVHRNIQGEINAFPCVEMEFNPKSNLVEFLFSPAEISDEIEQKAQEIAKNCAGKFNIVGTLAVEFFLLKSGELLINECAPRVHNSGHHTIECNYTSQFMQHLRAIANLPLGNTSIKSPGVMVNLVGEEHHQGIAKIEGFEEVLKMGNVYVHLYGKTETKPNRKIGHATIIHQNLDKAKELARQVMKTIRIVAE